MLNEEQQSLERRVDQLRLACQNVSKKVQSCLSGQGRPIDTDKRLVSLAAFDVVIQGPVGERELGAFLMSDPGCIFCGMVGSL